MKEEEKICFNCKHWNLDPEALDLRHQIIAKRMAAGSNESEKIISGMYGKCRAMFVDSKGNPQRYDMGTLGAQPCIAKDSQGNLLFEEVPT